MSQEHEAASDEVTVSESQAVGFRQRREKATFLQELPLFVGLVFVWCALWRDFSPGAFFFGLVVAVFVVKVFYLPPFEISNRFHCGWLLIFMGIFLWDVVAQSFKVFWVALIKGGRTKSAVVGVPLRASSDLVVTLTALTISLIPGSTVLEIDRSTSTIYLHVLDVQTLQQVQQARESTQKYEKLFIMICGSKEQVAALKQEKQNGGGSV